MSSNSLESVQSTEDARLAQKMRNILHRYRGASPQGLVEVLRPALVPIRSLDPTVFREAGQAHFRATFSIEIEDKNRQLMVVGRTGKFVPATYSTDGAWEEIAKGRIVSVDPVSRIATGEVYVGSGKRSDLDDALLRLTKDDLLEIDQYGAAAKVLSGLAEYELARIAREAGYNVYRMPEDMARHLGRYANYDYQLEKGGVTKRLEVKSLWGTDTRYARLIHSTTRRPSGAESTWTDQQKKNYYPTSSCKFETQDMFAVSLFLRTGNVGDFAFARSVPSTVADYGLPSASRHPAHVHQNPRLEIGDGKWFATIDEVWNLP